MQSDVLRILSTGAVQRPVNLREDGTPAAQIIVMFDHVVDEGEVKLVLMVEGRPAENSMGAAKAASVFLHHQEQIIIAVSKVNVVSVGASSNC